MSIGSILLIGMTAAYGALGRASGRLALAQAGLSQTQPPQCRPREGAPAASAKCELPEICEYDTVSQSCRTTTRP